MFFILYAVLKNNDWVYKVKFNREFRYLGFSILCHKQDKLQANLMPKSFLKSGEVFFLALVKLMSTHKNKKESFCFLFIFELNQLKLKFMFVILPILILFIFLWIFYYNSLIGKRNQVTNAFSAIDVMLKKRFDLIPNLVEIVKQYTDYEQSTLTKIVELRAKATSGSVSNTEKASLDAELSTTVRGLMVNVENYPDLKANASFTNLQTTWTESEEQIAAARRTYNAVVTDFNNAIMMFPGNLFAGMLSYTPIAVLATAEEERKNISAKELFNS